MKLKPAAKAVTMLSPNATNTVVQAGKEKLDTSPFYFLLYAIGQVMDQAVKEGNCYIILGATRDQSTLTASISLNGDKQTVYAPSGILELCNKLQALLEA